MKITTNAKKVLQSLDAYKRSLMGERFREFMEKLAEAGATVANAELVKATYSGTNDVVIEQPEWVGDNVLLLSARGNAVTFIEFGTGVHYTDTHEWADKLGFTRGGFGHGLGKLDSWRYPMEHGQGNGDAVEDLPQHPGFYRTHGNPPNRFMYSASKAMRQKAVEIAKEVFNG